MTDFDRITLREGPLSASDMALDAGLRRFMLAVYNKLALGLLVSAGLAYLTSTAPSVRDLLFRLTPDGQFAGYTLAGLLVAFAPLVVLLSSMLVLRRPTTRGAGALYWTICALIGASLGVLGLVYTGASLAFTFVIAAAGFGGLSLYGYATRRNLTGLGSFLMVGLLGLVGATLVGLFWNPPGFSPIVSVLGVLIFAGLIAYDTQRLKLGYYELGGDTAALGAASSYGALSLYLNFVNLFQFLLDLFGERR